MTTPENFLIERVSTPTPIETVLIASRGYAEHLLELLPYGTDLNSRVKHHLYGDERITILMGRNEDDRTGKGISITTEDARTLASILNEMADQVEGKR